jgi:hypothetical protein
VARNWTSVTEGPHDEGLRRNWTSVTKAPIRRNWTSVTEGPVRRNWTSVTEGPTRRPDPRRNWTSVTEGLTEGLPPKASPARPSRAPCREALTVVGQQPRGLALAHKRLLERRSQRCGRWRAALEGEGSRLALAPRTLLAGREPQRYTAVDS